VVEPGKRTLHHPATRQYYKAFLTAEAQHHLKSDATMFSRPV
jgi:hypothetical protein